MSGEQWCVVDLGPVRVALLTDHPGLIDYLREFYPLTEPAGPDGVGDRVDWVLEARLAPPGAGMALTPWRVGYHADAHTRRAVLCSTNARDLAITVRKAVREVLLDYCQARGSTMLHASAVAGEGRVILVVGEEGSGKTTLALDATLTWGYRYLSNDHLICYRERAGLVVTSLPTLIPVTIGTYLDYADQLGRPWEDEGVEVEEYRRMPAELRYGSDRRLLFTYRSLGQANPLHTRLGGRQVVVVLARYAPAGEPVSTPVPVAEPVAALWPQVRFDWVLDPARNTHYLPRAERDRHTYATDARTRLAELVTGSRVLAWRHRGRVRPLLDWLASQ